MATPMSTMVLGFIGAYLNVMGVRNPAAVGRDRVVPSLGGAAEGSTGALPPPSSGPPDSFFDRVTRATSTFTVVPDAPVIRPVPGGVASRGRPGAFHARPPAAKI